MNSLLLSHTRKKSLKLQVTTPGSKQEDDNRT
jgi:hypothetical protein